MEYLYLIYNIFINILYILISSFNNSYSSNINGNSQETSIHPLSDSTGYILFGQFASQSRAYIWKQIVSPSVLNANCQYVPSIYQFSYAHLKITDTQVFFGGIDQSTTSFHFIKMTLGNSVVDWSNNLSWPTSSWNTFGSEALLSSDGTLIYSFVAYGNPRKMYFITFNAASGAVVGNRYKSSVSMSAVFGSVLMGNYTGKLHHIKKLKNLNNSINFIF